MPSAPVTTQFPSQAGVVGLLMAGLCLSPVARGAVGPAPSVWRLPTANGRSVLVFGGDDSGTGVIDRWSDRVYQQQHPAAEVVRDLAYDTYFGFANGTESGWLTRYESVDYEVGTGIIVIRRRSGDLELTERVWAPQGFDAPGSVHLLEVSNLGTTNTGPFSVFSLHNFHVGSADGGGSYTAREQLVGEPGLGGFTETGVESGLIMLSLPLTAATKASCTDVWNRVNAATPLDSACSSTGDDRVGAFQWDHAGLGAGERATFGYLQVFSTRDNLIATRSTLSAWQDGREGPELLDEERSFWTGIQDRANLPTGLSAEEEAIWRQALAFLLLSQVQEEGPAHGQIPASMPNSSPVGGFAHEWNITWVRDSSYALRALSEAGFAAEATDGLAFLLQDELNGEYASYLGVDDYAVSVCRSYGEGREWSDWDSMGPNVELDNFGLVLWAAEGVLDAEGIEPLRPLLPAMLDGVADILLQTIDPAWDLIMADSSIWERHWDGNQKHFTYTSAFAVAGLRAAARIAEAAEDPRASAYAEGAARIAGGIREHLVVDGVVVGNLEEVLRGTGSLDLAAVEAFNLEIVDARGAELGASLAAWEDLRVASGNGYMRNDDGDLYDRHEWIMVDLRLAEALRRGCRPEAAAALETWVAGQALENHNMIPELYEPETGVYAGPVPMLGFGSGLYLMQMQRRAALDAACAGMDTGGGETGDGGGSSDGADGADGGVGDGSGADGGSTGGSTAGSTEEGEDTGETAKEGCGCASGPSAGGGLLLLLVGLWRRRGRT